MFGRATGLRNWLLTLMIGIVAADVSAAEKPESGVGVALGKAVLTGHMTTAELSFRHSRWELGATLLGYGSTDEGEQERLGYGVSVTRLLHPDWHLWKGTIYGRLGVAYIDSSPLVGHFNFRTGMGIEFEHFSLEYLHYSSAGLTPLNTGIDVIQFRVPF
ncbi:acyloxyacyl hydrolase [Microbulbifer magnicolonia]|uniref:acyloxyacyl hydrolase n=1 Tax=Microbulbifer magnicolonia TaxID=3109744 RepID=UPI002B4087CD|nr:acyloxyacyl hydrolase [Microbulbifer sp. GG15]